MWNHVTHRDCVDIYGSCRVQNVVVAQMYGASRGSQPDRHRGMIAIGEQIPKARSCFGSRYMYNTEYLFDNVRYNSLPQRNNNMPAINHKIAVIPGDGKRDPKTV